MNEEQRIDKRFYSALFIATILFMIYMVFIGRGYGQPIKSISKVHFIGTYEVNGQIRPIEELKTYGVEKNQPVIFRGHLDKHIPPGREMFFYMYCMRMIIKRNGEEIYRYGYSGDHPEIVKSMGTDWAHFNAREINKEDWVEIILEPVYDNIYKGAYSNFLNKIYVGDRFAFLRLQIKRNLFQILGSMSTFVLGVIFLAVMSALHYIKEPVSDGYISGGFLMISGAICTSINYNYTTLFFNNSFLVNMIDFLLQFLICFFFMTYLMNYMISKRYRLISRIFIKITICLMILCFIIQSYGIVDELQTLEILLPIAIIFLVIMIIFLMKDYKKYSEWRIKKVLISSLIFATTAIIEMIHYVISDIYWGFLFQAGLLIFEVMQISVALSYTKESIERVRRADMLEKELVQNRIAIMMSQIQPHFLYNALTSIQELCLDDPNKAHTVVMKFAQFLRGNMDSLKTDKLIPFEKELKHVKNYLYLEQMRYGEYLDVEYEIEVSDFLLPALAVQPIVENAVRYGVGKSEKGGIVIIRSAVTEEYHRIIVEDNGIGFNVEEMQKMIEQDSKRSHVGLDNVRNRLKEQCNGELKVESQIGQGTRVTILIPRRRG
ncbi:MAG: histidine kinase [Cellulosilyticum sp.]|nr:histidine kinase [Cellulosilyticum sp.]